MVDSGFGDYHADDQYASDPRAKDVTLCVERLPFRGDVTVRHWRIDATHSNSHAATATRRGRPRAVLKMRPKPSCRRFVPGRGSIGWSLTAARACTMGQLTLKLSLSLPSVSLIELFQPRSQ